MPAADGGGISFDAPFHVQVAQARAMAPMLAEAFYGLTPEKRALAFTVSGLARLDQVQAVADSLAAAEEQGWSFAKWKAWAEAQDWTLPRHRLETIFRTNLQTNYMAGHWRNFELARRSRPWLMFDAINDSRVRPHHLALDGVIRAVDDPVWDRISPPLGFNCRCTLRSLTDRAARRRGGRTEIIPAEGHADGGQWGRRPRKLLERLRDPVEARATRCDERDFVSDPTGKPIWCSEARAAELLTLLTAYTRPDPETCASAARTELFREFVDGAPGAPDLWPIAVLDDDLMATLGVRKSVVWLSRQTLASHLAKHPEIGADEYGNISKVIAGGEVWTGRDEGRYVIIDRIGGFRLALKSDRRREYAWVLSLVRARSLRPNIGSERLR